MSTRGFPLHGAAPQVWNHGLHAAVSSVTSGGSHFFFFFFSTFAQQNVVKQLSVNSTLMVEGLSMLQHAASSLYCDRKRVTAWLLVDWTTCNRPVRNS